MSTETSVGTVETDFNQEAYLLLVAFGGQLEPKINRELMAHGIPVQRVEVATNGELELEDLDLTAARGIILSGGNDSVYDENARRLPLRLMELPVPKLGICYGHQEMLHTLGGQVDNAPAGEHGAIDVIIQPSPLFDGIPLDKLRVLMNHRDVVTTLPRGFRAIAESPAGIAGATDDQGVYTIQFHPESGQTEYGTQILLNFATNICGLTPEPGFTADTYRQRVMKQAGQEIRHKLGATSTRTIVLDSGGVDSAAAHALTVNGLRPIGHDQNVSGIYVDCGLMRHEDGDTIRTMNELGYTVETQDWSDFFLHQPVPLPPAAAAQLGRSHLPPMDSLLDHNVMRKVVKFGFIEVQRQIGERLRERFSDAEVIALVQGTNLADKIESGDFKGDQIKEHHNSGVEEYVDVLVEPLNSLFKGDIRLIAKALGLPDKIADRQPFPGPGLCLRITVNADGEPVWTINQDTARWQLDALCKKIGGGIINGVWLPVQATGQKGDSRKPGHMVALHGPYEPEVIEQLAFAIPAQTSATRVIYTPNEIDPTTIKAIPQMVNESSLAPLRDAEQAKSEVVVATGLGTDLSQHYVASLAVSLDGSNQPTLMSRMFRTGVRTGLEDFIDGEAALGGVNVDETKFRRVLDAIAHLAPSLGYGSAVYDVTNKPPGTVELY